MNGKMRYPSNVAIIACAGKGRRWTGPCAKHLIEIDGETLLDRSLRLIGVDHSIYVMSSTESGGIYVKTDSTNEVDKILSSQELWAESGYTRILFGDTWFSEAAMRKILNDHHPLRWFGRFGGSSLTGKDYGEIFALSFHTSAQSKLVAHAKAAGESNTDVAGAWATYRHMHGIPLWCADMLGGDWTEIDDWTEDFDFEIDLVRWLKNRG